MDHRRRRLTETQQRRLLELLGCELRAAVARRGGAGGAGGDDADDRDDDDAHSERVHGCHAALAEYVETRRSALECAAAERGAEPRSAGEAVAGVQRVGRAGPGETGLIDQDP